MNIIKKQQEHDAIDCLEGMEEELYKDFSYEELRNIICRLKESSVKYPDEQQLENTITACKAYMPKVINIKNITKDVKLFDKLKLILTYCNKIYILVSVLIYVIGFYLTTSGYFFGSPYRAAMILSPIPFIIGLSAVFKSRSAGMEELEMSFKINSIELGLIRLVLMCIFNNILSLILSIAFLYTDKSLELSKMMICWCLPFVTISGISLFIAIKIKNYNFTQFIITLWSIFSFIIISSEKISNWILNLNALVIAGIGVAGGMLWVYNIILIYTRSVANEAFD